MRRSLIFFSYLEGRLRCWVNLGFNKNVCLNMYLDYWVNLSKNKNGRISKSIERKIKTKTGQLYENK